MIYFFGLLIGFCAAIPPHSDYLKLKSAIKSYVSKNAAARVPKLVRLSFHDVANYDPSIKSGGGHGCIQYRPIINNPENNGLTPTILDLQNIIKTRFPRTGFSLGDVISLAGKVAVEYAYPCIKVKWRYGRRECKSGSEETVSFPKAFNQFDQISSPFWIGTTCR